MPFACSREDIYRQLFRALIAATATLTIAACVSMPRAKAPMTGAVSVFTPDPTPAALKKYLQPQDAAQQSASAPANRLLAFYEARNFQPAWTGSSGAEHMSAELKSILGRAREQGLREDDYRLPPESHPAPGNEAAEYDIALTGAALRYARDVRLGRVLPAEVYSDARLPVAKDSIASGLAAAVGHGEITDFFAGLPPVHPEYRRLAKALARYSAIAAEDGWPTLPNKEIRLTGNEKEFSLLITRLSFEDPDLAAIQNPSRNDVVAAVKRFQARNGLEQDGRVRGDTLTALNVPAKTRVAQIAANMERWRWMPAELEHRYIAVNVPDQSAQFVRDGEVVLTSRVIVGRKASPTPITRAEISSVVVNPPWDIPGDIAARDLLPHLRKDANYLAARHMVVTDGPAGDPYGRTINWRKIQAADFPYAIRQLPGPEAGLGALMLDSPNDFDVYLHDTPDKKLFAGADREISNGCVRVQQIFPLASLVLEGDEESAMPMLKQTVATHQTKRLSLKDPVPVYFLYWTAMVDENGAVHFRPDRNNRDTVLVAAMSGTAEHGPAKSPSSEAPPNESLGP